MPIHQIELEEVQMMEASDEALEASSGGGTAFASCPAIATCATCSFMPLSVC